MPRNAREKSETGIYHIVQRGSNKQIIFHEDDDFVRYLCILQNYKNECALKLYGWCLMDNHIHLLIQEGNEDLSVTMKRISVSFVRYYNTKYSCTGHLFQDRYWSEKVENTGYLFAVIRYIHQNPAKAGIVKSCNDWRWSSYHVYFDETASNLLLDKDLILNTFSNNKDFANIGFKNFNEMTDDSNYLDINSRGRLTDEDAAKIIQELIQDESIINIKYMKKAQRDAIISEIKVDDRFTFRQIARILGVGANLVSRAK